MIDQKELAIGGWFILYETITEDNPHGWDGPYLSPESATGAASFFRDAKKDTDVYIVHFDKGFRLVDANSGGSLYEC